ncbi:MAG: hypothetical protein AAFM92_03325 [Pseudomonadota bacterium]
MATLQLAEWEIREIKNAIRIAAEDGAYDDDMYGLGAEMDKLQVKLSRALERAKK